MIFIKIKNTGEGLIRKNFIPRPDIPFELADIVIRVFDMCGHYGIDLESAIREKNGI
jgi:NTP pyrophosphatase (non-canonical NTP hydrolase)